MASKRPSAHIPSSDQLQRAAQAERERILVDALEDIADRDHQSPDTARWRSIRALEDAGIWTRDPRDHLGSLDEPALVDDPGNDDPSGRA